MWIMSRHGDASLVGLKPTLEEHWYAVAALFSTSADEDDSDTEDSSESEVEESDDLPGFWGEHPNMFEFLFASHTLFAEDDDELPSFPMSSIDDVYFRKGDYRLNSRAIGYRHRDSWVVIHKFTDEESDCMHFIEDLLHFSLVPVGPN